MRVLIVSGPAAGTYVEKVADEENFILDGENYILAYEIYEQNSKMPWFKLAAPIALHVQDLREVPESRALGEIRPAPDDIQWRYFPNRCV